MSLIGREVACTSAVMECLITSSLTWQNALWYAHVSGNHGGSYNHSGLARQMTLHPGLISNAWYIRTGPLAVITPVTPELCWKMDHGEVTINGDMLDGRMVLLQKQRQAINNLLVMARHIAAVKYQVG